MHHEVRCCPGRVLATSSRRRAQGAGGCGRDGGGEGGGGKGRGGKKDRGAGRHA